MNSTQSSVSQKTFSIYEIPNISSPIKTFPIYHKSPKFEQKYLHLTQKYEGETGFLNF
jgi:hypothetical protein